MKKKKGGGFTIIINNKVASAYLQNSIFKLIFHCTKLCSKISSRPLNTNKRNYSKCHLRKKLKKKKEDLIFKNAFLVISD